MVEIAHSVNFANLKLRSGEVGARAEFEKIVYHLVALRRPGATQIRGDGGDWGIDVVVGDLVLNEIIAVWQSKYFPDGLKTPQRRQIEVSFEAAIDGARRVGYLLGHWTLALPCLLTPAEKRWWDTFRRSREKEFDLVCELWDQSRLGALLYAPEATSLRKAYFGWNEVPTPLPIVDPPEDGQFDGALFVKQLGAVPIAETTSARRQFFNADLLRREVRDKAVADELVELNSRSEEVHAVWETRFNGRAGDPSDDLAQLYGDVMTALESYHRATPVRMLRASEFHTLGLIHVHVDEARAGWCRRWREIAAEHVG
jgi:hypothetical protein